MNNKDLWNSVLAEIQLNISQANFNTWFKDTEIVLIEDGEAVVSVPNCFAREWLEHKFNRVILKIINKSSNGKIKKIKYSVTNKESEKKPQKPVVEEKTVFGQLDFQELKISKETNLNPKYTFENFIVGPFNELPHAAGQAVSQNPGSLYNPLFIYGGTGLGKTHLMQAIGNEVIKNHPKKRVKYVSVETFTSEVVSSIRNNSMDDFKSKYRQVDVLIIDDIQFLSGKEKTQEEFFHTFNSLYEKNKQIILSSDRPPRSIQSLAERLRSRFEGGMITDISHPDLETRLAILKSKAQEKQINFNEDVYYYLAENVQKNIRELEGVLNTLIAKQKLGDKAIDLIQAKKILKDSFSGTNNNITHKSLIKAVVQFYDIKEKELLDSSRKREIVKPRQIAMYLLRNELKCSFSFIGEKLGGRDHTTVMHSCEKMEKEIEKSDSVKEEIELIKQLVSSL